MDTELIRFRINADIKRQAANVCADLGIELNDLLRRFVTRVASEGKSPIDVPAPAQPPSNRVALFGDYDERAWGAVMALGDEEFATVCLMSYIAECDRQLHEASERGARGSKRIAEWTALREAAQAALAGLDSATPQGVREIIERFSAPPQLPTAS
jgi:addiction module RelB/DinJ family antitoxin